MMLAKRVSHRLAVIQLTLRLHAQRALGILSGQERIYRPEIACAKDRLGSAYGGWSFCPDGLNAESVVYSVGLGNDISFDRAIIQKYGVQVFGFDPTPTSLAYLATQQLPAQFCYFPYALAAEDGNLAFFPPPEKGHVSFSLLPRTASHLAPTEKPVLVAARRLQSIMQELGHDHIDILKMDVEGAEYAILEEMLNSGIRPRQLLVEFHHRFQSIGFAKTRAVIAALHGIGYRILTIGQAGLDYSFVDTRVALAESHDA